jgi:hypothetical protein
MWPDMSPRCAPLPRVQLMSAGRLPQHPCRHRLWVVVGLKRPSGRGLPAGFTPYAIMSPGGCARPSMVDTPERWQGLERKVMVAVHPLSGVTSPSSFDLETGRLCVMISRHRSGLVLVSRDHVKQTLETRIPLAEQALGRPDVTGRGHSANLAFWESVERDARLVRAA